MIEIVAGTIVLGLVAGLVLMLTAVALAAVRLNPFPYVFMCLLIFGILIYAVQNGGM